MKRFTETTKWSDPWFMDLPGPYKLFWLYLLDHCDNAGVWQPNIRLAQFQASAQIDEEKALELFSDRVDILDNGRWYIHKFIGYQYGTLSEACKPHMAVIKLLDQHKIQRVSKGYPKGIHTLEEKDKEKDKESDEDSKPKTDLPKNWLRWSDAKKKTHRTSHKEPLMDEVGALLGRSKASKWTLQELQAFLGVSPSKDELDALQPYYSAIIDKGEDYRRTSILTLLNNWSGEMDKARAFKANNR